MGSENGHFCLLSVHRGWLGGSEKVQKPACVIFEWSLSDHIYYTDAHISCPQACFTCSKLEAMVIYVVKSANSNDIIPSVYKLHIFGIHCKKWGFLGVHLQVSYKKYKV